MNRMILTFGGVLSASSLLLMDSAIKGAVLLALAAIAALMLRRDSAATRHLVWMMAIVALLIVPILSATLPQWRVLPTWMSSQRPTVAAIESVSPPALAKSTGEVLDMPQLATSVAPMEVDQPTAPEIQPVTANPVSEPTMMTPEEMPASNVKDWNWTNAIPLVWAIGFVFLMLRLSAARWMLWNSERLAMVIGRHEVSQLVSVKRKDSSTSQDPIVIAMTALCGQLKVRRPITLLVHPHKTIPVVWGIFRCRLMLPVAARQWSEEQLQSVLMHELAHIKRGDTLVQLLTQIACALHWFNPLVWFAAWRLDVERERSCDDLVLASGIRPSAYAAHLLDVVSGLSPARWTQACGLAMARKSSLEGRLTAVLGENLNRRGVSVALAGLALATAIGIAVPIAMLRAQDGKQIDELESSDENKQNPQDKSANSSMKIELNTEAQLDWGETVNGLRAATVIHGQPLAICLAVQNVSQTPLRIADTVQTKDLRKLILSDSKGILVVFTADQPTLTNVLLQPREVVYLRMMPPVKEGEHSVESALIEGLRKDALQSWEIALKMESAPEGAWKGTLVTAPTRAAVSVQSPQPNTKEGRALYKRWQDTARRNGDIPGGQLSILHGKVKEFIRNNEPDASGGPVAKRMKPLEPRFSNTGDWKPADVVAILDDIAAVSTIPIETTIEHLAQRSVRFGQQLPAAWKNADWGKPLEGGLRMAYVLEPLAGEYHIGTEMKARIVLHNSGKEPVTFVTTEFQQPTHTATLANGGELKVESTDWLTRGRPQAYRLAPGEFCEVQTSGLGIGAQNKDLQEWSDVRAGSWILCKEGDEVIFSPGAALLSGMNELPNSGDWWREFIAQRLAREMPVPENTIEREYLLYRVVRELYGAAPSTTEGDAFAADKSPDALKNLAVLLAKHPYGKQSRGFIQPGKTKFRVLPPDPDAAKRPRIATTPGRYKLSDEVRLIVTRRGQGNRVINEGSVTWFPPGKENISLDLKLPVGSDTWAAGWEQGTTVLWVSQKGLLQSVNFADPSAMKVTRYEGAEFATAPIPVTLRAAIEKAIVVPDASSSIRDPQPPASLAPALEPPKPKLKDAQAHYEVWQRFARANGDIPGALVGELAKAINVFIGYNPTWETVPKLNAILPRLDATRDWKPADAVSVLDEVASVQATLLEPAPWKGTRQTIRKGEALPKKYADASWGEEQPSGLRAAWLLEPSATEHRIGAALKARLLVHNRGQVPVMLQVPTWHQGAVKATDAKGSEVQVSGIEWTTMALLYTVHLGPGEYIEINTPGVGIGPRAGMGPWAGPRVGSNVLATAGDELTLTYSPVPLDGSEVGISEEDPHVSGPLWWLAHIKARLNRELPLPSDAAERTRMLDRAVRELFATAPTAEETEAFIADKTPDAIDALAKRLAARTDAVSFSGKLPTAPVKFRVLDADANADKQPRVVLGPGEYPLSGGTATSGAVTLKIIGRPMGDRRTNDAQILFEATEATGKLLPDPHKLEVPDGWGTWAIVCRPSDGYFYLLHKGTVRKIDYSKPHNVTDTPTNDLPAEFRDEVKRQLDIHEISAALQAEIFENPAAPAAASESKTSANVPAKPSEAGTPKLPKAAKQEPLSTLATGQLELEIKEPEKLPSEKETPTGPSNTATEPAKPKPNYVRVVGQLLDDETGQPIEKAGWEWGMADPNKPDQISWGHSRSMGKSHPDGKFEMPLNISTNGNHYPLRVYAAGYETTVVVGELAKPYPEKIERNIRLKRGRSITGVLRDHTGNPVANGWVFFIPKGHQTNIVESIPGTDAHQLPAIARDGAVSEVRTNENGTFALPTGVAGTLAASTDLVDLWPFPLPDDGYAELKMPAPSYLVIDLTYWYLAELVKKGEHELSPNSEDPNQCWIHVDQSGSTEPLWKNLGYRRQMLVFAKDPRAKLSKGVIVGHVVEGEMDKPIPDIGHNKNLSTKIRVALPPGNYRVQRLRTGPFAPVDEQNVELKSGEDTILSWARGDGSSVRGKATWPANMMFVRQQGEAPRKLDWTVPYTATVWIAPVGADGKDGKPIDAAKIQADGSFFVPTNLDPGKYKATARVSLPESDDSRRSSGWRGPDCIATAEFTIPEPARGPFGSPPVELEIKMEVGENVRFLRSNALADPPQAVQPPAGKPKLGAMLKSATEQKLKWGEPVNGLRAALVMQPVPDEPDAEDKNDVFLVVQNVTKAEVWLHSSDAAPNPRQLIWRDKGVLETVTEVAKPIPADVRLQPGEVAFFRMTQPPGKRNPGGRSEGSLIEESIRNDPTFSLEGSMKISTAPNGAWSGKLVTGRTEGGTAIPADANIDKVPGDQYVKSSVSVDELAGEGVMWNDVQNGLSLGYRITSDEWRILGKEVKVELWVQNHGDKEVKFQDNMRADPEFGLRVKLKDAKGEDHNSNFWPDDRPPFGFHRLLPPGHAIKMKEFTISLFWPDNDFSHAKGHFFGIAPGAYNFHCELELPGFSATGEGGKQLTPAAGEWTGKLTTRGLNIEIIAPDAPATKPRTQSVEVRISKDGEISLDRKKMPLEELKTRAARNAKKWFTIKADDDVPYAKVIAVIKALKASGVTEFSFAEARVGDGKYRVANRTGSYEFDAKRRLSICQPFERKQWFTVAWPAKDGQPAKSLRLYPNASEQTRGTWAVVWEPGTDVLWWVDDSDIGKMTLTDPARVIVERKGRNSSFSRDFTLPDGVATEFRRLGFEVGGKPGEPLVIGGPTSRQEVLTAEPVDANRIQDGAVPKRK